MRLSRGVPVTTALVLAAGLGERLRPLTYTKPKPLLPLGGRPLIWYPLMMLKRAGVRRVAINLHHLGPSIEQALGNGSALGLAITYAPEPILLGTGGPLVALRAFFGDATFWVANSDTILDFDLGAMVDFHRHHRALATLALVPSRPDVRYSLIETDPEGRVRRIRLANSRVGARSADQSVERKLGEGAAVYDDYPAQAPAHLLSELKPHIFCGLTLCEPSLVRFAPKQPAFGIVSHLLAPLIARGAAIYGYALDGYFRTVDDLTSYEALCAEFAAGGPALSYIRG
jgi:NDP-sugar pyrophosphorylase family protein